MRAYGCRSDRRATVRSARPARKVSDLARDEESIAGPEPGDPLPGAPKFRGPFLQIAIDLGHRRGESVGIGREQLFDAGEWHPGLGKVDAVEYEMLSVGIAQAADGNRVACRLDGQCLHANHAATLTLGQCQALTQTR